MSVNMLTSKDQGGFANHTTLEEPGSHTSEWVNGQKSAAMNRASASESNDTVATNARPTTAAVDTLDKPTTATVNTLEKPSKKVRFSTCVDVAEMTDGHEQDASWDQRYVVDLKSAGPSWKEEGWISKKD